MDSSIWSIPYTIRSDGSPCNTIRFTCTCEMGINHKMSSRYNPSSNRASERGVQQIKRVLEKTGKKSKISEEELESLVFVFRMNSQKQKGGQDSAEKYAKCDTQPLKGYK